MDFYVLTLFPEMVDQCLDNSITGRAKNNQLINIKSINIRDYTTEKHGHVDDYPYGGGAGMLMQAEPVYQSYLAVKEMSKSKKPRVVYMTPQGKPFTQEMAEDFSKEEELVFLCGHYEGIDERVIEEIVTDQVSLGDFVLTGGELPAMVMIDCISRLVKGVLNNDESAEIETFHDHLLEYPQYTRPPVWRDKEVPDVLLSGHHENIEKWRLLKSRERTKELRPDLYQIYEEEHKDELKKEREKEAKKMARKLKKLRKEHLQFE